MDNLPKYIRRLHVIDGIYVGDRSAIHRVDAFHSAGIRHALVLPDMFSVPDLINDSRFFDFNLPLARGTVHMQMDDSTMRLQNRRRDNLIKTLSDSKSRFSDTLDEVLYADIKPDTRIPDDVLKAGIEFVCKHVKAGHKILIVTDNVIYGTPMLFIFGYLLNKGYPLPELVRAMVAKVNVPRLYRHHWEQLLAYFNQSYSYDDIQKWVLEGWEQRGASV